MSTFNTVEGSTLSIVEVFLDEHDSPVLPSNTSPGPEVRLYDTDKAVIAERIAVPDSQEPGAWRVDIPIPRMGLSDTANLKCVWRFRGQDGDMHKATHSIRVDPQNEDRPGDVIVIVGRDMYVDVVLPFEFTPPRPKIEADVVNGLPAYPSETGDSLFFSMYRNNQPLFESMAYNDQGVQLERYSTKTVAKIPAVVGTAKVEPILLLVEHRRKGALIPTVYTFKVWPITPQVLLAANEMEAFINKARINNVIPELDYTTGDLLEYLHRGLNMYNALPPQLTAFNGTNMQGIVLEGWLQCSSYYALGAQLQAEGALAFDFSGQSVSLNVDRSPSIEAALGRIEGLIESQIKPTKKLLVKAGINSGDGSQGGRFVDGSSQLGAVSLINAPTTRLPFGGIRNGWQRPLF